MRINIIVFCILLIICLIKVPYIDAQEIIYTNHVGLYNNRNNAENIRNKLEDYGFKVYMDDKPPYRVTVGRNDNWGNALAIQKNLNKLKFNSYITEIWKEYIKRDSQNHAARKVVYTNHVGLYNNRNNAENIRRKLEDYGFKVYMDDKPPYRVTVGRSDNWGDALAIQKKLNKLKFNSYIIEIWKEYIEKKVENVENVDDADNHNNVQNLEKDRAALKTIKIDSIKSGEKSVKAGEGTIKFGGNNINIGKNKKLKTIDFFPLESDSILKGMFGSQTLFFFFNKYWNADKHIYLNFNYSYSQSVTKRNSSVTIYINKKPIYSLKLGKHKASNNLKIEIPKKMIVHGYNSIEITVSADNERQDNYNLADWFIINDMTSIHLNYTDGIKNLKISNYPYPFLNVGRKDPVNSVFVIPEEFSNYHLSTLAYLAAGFGKREPYEDLNLKVITANNIDDYKDQNMIFIGNNKDFDDIEDFPKSSKDSNLIELFTSPWNKDKKILWLTGRSEKIADLAKFLFLDKIVEQMNSTKQSVKNLDTQVESDIFLGDRITFEMLAYDNFNLSGRNQLKALYDYDLPAGWELREGAYLNLKFRYSQAINFKESSIMVKINGIPVASKKLSREEADGDNLICKFPEELLTKRSFNIEVQFHFGRQKTDEITWAVISNQSFLNIAHEQVDGMNLGNYPDLFFKNGTLHDLVVVLSNQVDIYDINIMANIFAYMGRLANNINDIYVIRAQDMLGEMKNKNIMFLGIPEENPIIKQLNRYLPVSFNQDFTQLVSTKDYFFLEGIGQEAGIVQMIDSIWNPGKVIITVSAVNKSALKNTELLLSNINVTPELSGQVAMMDDFGQLYTFDNKSIDKKTNSGLMEMEEKLIDYIKDNNRLMTVMGIMLVLIIIVLLIMHIFYRKSKKNYFKRG